MEPGIDWKILLALAAVGIVIYKSQERPLLARQNPG